LYVYRVQHRDLEDVAFFLIPMLATPGAAVLPVISTVATPASFRAHSGERRLPPAEPSSSSNLPKPKTRLFICDEAYSASRYHEEDHLISLEDGGNPTDPRNLWPEPYNTTVGGVIMGAHQKDVVEGFIHDEICYDIPNSKKHSYIPATASVTLKRGQEILAGDWYACYESIKEGKPCK
jgi:hypothetical protein